MSFWTDLRMPTEQELLIGFYDLSGYTRYAEHTEPQRLLGQIIWSMHGSCLGAHSNICETESRTRHNP